MLFIPINTDPRCFLLDGRGRFLLVRKCRFSLGDKECDEKNKIVFL